MTTHNIIIGIDPGAAPTACVYMGDPGGPFEFLDEGALSTAAGNKGQSFPNAVLLAGALRAWRPDLVVLEQVQPMPKWGISSATRFIGAFRYVQAVVETLGYRLHMARPQTWQPVLGLRQRGPEACRQRALELFPAAAGFLGRKKDHNRAAALLLAAYGHRFVLGGTP